jgi:hypothetical protein
VNHFEGVLVKLTLAELDSHLDVISRRIALRVERAFYHELFAQYLPQLGFLTGVILADPNVPAPPVWEAVVSASLGRGDPESEANVAVCG